MILTRADGTPIEDPGPPPPAGAPVRDVVNWLRADCRYRDEVSSLASGAFARRFHSALR